MSMQIARQEEQSSRYSREEYIRLARESCMKNYFGDQMKSRDSILKEVEEKKKQEEAATFSKNHPVVIPFEEGKQQRSERAHLLSAKTGENFNKYPEERMNADIINRRLAINKGVTQDTTRIPELDLMEVGPSEDMIPTSADILKMSGMEAIPEEPLSNQYVETFKNTYHKEENPNFLTSIRNAEPAEEDKKEKDASEVRSFRWFVVRCVCAFAILTAVILLDKFAFNYKGVEAKTFYEKIVSTELMEQVEEWLQAEAAK